MRGGLAKQRAGAGVNTGMHYKAARAFTFGEKCLHYGLWSTAIFIHYLACFVCIAVERGEAVPLSTVEMLFCLDFCLLFMWIKFYFEI